MADKIADGVSFSCARRALHQNPSVFLELLGNTDLLGIGGLAQQHFAIRGSGTARGWMRVSPLGNRRFFSNNIQKGPTPTFALPTVPQQSPLPPAKTQLTAPPE